MVIVDKPAGILRRGLRRRRVPRRLPRLKTRRHTGADFVLITQSPHLLINQYPKLRHPARHIYDTFVSTTTRMGQDWRRSVGGRGRAANVTSRRRQRFRSTSPPSCIRIARKYPWYIYLFCGHGSAGDWVDLVLSPSKDQSAGGQGGKAEEGTSCRNRRR